MARRLRGRFSVGGTACLRMCSTLHPEARGVPTTAFYSAWSPERAIALAASLLAPLTPMAPSNSLPRIMGPAPGCGLQR